MRTRLLLLCTLVLGACNPVPEARNPRFLADQSGAMFGWECNGNPDCRVSRLDLEPTLPDCRQFDLMPTYLHSWGDDSRFFEITGACIVDGQKGTTNGYLTTPTWSRLVVCSDDRECPQLPAGDIVDTNGTVFRRTEVVRYECRAGFCQNADVEKYPPHELPNRGEMLSLCYGATPRAKDGRMVDYPPELYERVNPACPVREGEYERQARCTRIPEGCPDPR